MKTGKKLTTIAVGVGLSVLTLALFFWNLDISKVRAGLGHANWPLLTVAILLGYFGHLTLRSLRWRLMLQPLKDESKGPLSFYNLFSTTAIGYAVSWLTPGRIGEIVRPLLLARRESLPGASAIATVGLERILDAAAVLVLASISALAAPLWARGAGDEQFLAAARWLGLAGLVGTTAGLLVLRGLVREGSGFLALLDRKHRSAEGILKHLWTFARRLAEGATFLRDASRSLWIGVYSVLIWVLIGVSIWIGVLAAGVRIPFVGVFLLLALSVIGIAVPTPGGAGTVHLAFQQGLVRLFGIDPSLASVATVLYHPVMVYIPPVLFGLLFAWRDGLSLGKLRRLAGKETPEPDDGEAKRRPAGGDGPPGGDGPAGGAVAQGAGRNNRERSGTGFLLRRGAGEIWMNERSGMTARLPGSTFFGGETREGGTA